MEAFRQIVLRKNQDCVKISELSPEDLENMPQIALVSSFRKCTA